MAMTDYLDRNYSCKKWPFCKRYGEFSEINVGFQQFKFRVVNHWKEKRFRSIIYMLRHNHSSIAVTLGRFGSYFIYNIHIDDDERISRNTFCNLCNCAHVVILWWTDYFSFFFRFLVYSLSASMRFGLLITGCTVMDRWMLDGSNLWYCGYWKCVLISMCECITVHASVLLAIRESKRDKLVVRPAETVLVAVMDLFFMLTLGWLLDLIYCVLVSNRTFWIYGPQFNV